MKLELDLENEIGAIRLYAADDHPKTAETIRVEHALGKLKGELVLKFDAQGRLLTIVFMHPSKQLLPSQLEGVAGEESQAASS
jgi:hypothetical protein